jgi:predicted RNA-binding Zn-ribbon protein involved in translation (DUF1610 family)
VLAAIGGNENRYTAPTIVTRATTVRVRRHAGDAFYWLAGTVGRMGHCVDCGDEVDELLVSETQVASGVVYECPNCGAIAGVSDATDI